MTPFSRDAGDWTSKGDDVSAAAVSVPTDSCVVRLLGAVVHKYFSCLPANVPVRATHSPSVIA